MKSYVMGIDFGSTTAKTVILGLQERMLSSQVAHMGAVSGEGVAAGMTGALDSAGLAQADIGRTVAMMLQARVVIDTGGQDSNVIAVGAEGPVVMTGGVARNKAAVHDIEEALGEKPILPAMPQIAGARGAALIVLDDHRTEQGYALSVSDDDAHEVQTALDKACVPDCTGMPELAVRASARRDNAAALWKRVQAQL